MKKIYLLIVILSLTTMFIACENGTDESASGTLMIQAFDAPFQGDVEHINLNIIEVSVHRADADSSSDSTSGWITLSETDTTIDFLELVNGQMASLLEEDLEVGQYSQLRLLLGDSSAIVVDGVSHELRIPSGSQSGVKLNLGFSIAADEIVEIYLDFDAARSISKHPTQDRYTMRPTFKVFKSILSGTLAGTVTDTLGTGMEDIVVQAVLAGDTTSTITSEAGAYKFILLEGSYDLSATGFELQADTSYASVDLTSGDQLSGYNFILR
ncbi:MAG: DUF4382 domain-containing protein [Candidatus Marinimicrobia bacterium]|nr:DUF4382 domain-containing protein [Candidatus Neomarinimicrobiota bacterium]